ncbi:phage tail assembly chaperone [Roseibium sp.]|uniref:phage tail assembly chaperone n=1 Tax=Roseibium sp. TaxID=1936156 RepID=UPI003A974A31
MLMQAAFRQLGWTPPVFWAATPFELASALGLSAQRSRLTRSGLIRLMDAFPD